MKYNKAICEMLDKVVKRLVEENKIIQCGHSNLEKYIAGYIVDSMLQYKENATFETNMTEKWVMNLYNYDENENLLKDIVQFVYEDEKNQYPLILDYWICYEMIVNFCEQGIVECLSCGNIFYHQGRLFTDEDGLFSSCKKCGATFNIR